MKLTRDIIVPRDALGSCDGTEGVEVTPDLEVLVFISLAGGGQVGHHNFFLFPRAKKK